MSPDVPAGYPAAHWTRYLSRVMADMKTAAASDPDAWERAITRIDARLPFIEFWLPLVQLTSRRLIAMAPSCERWLHDDARAALERHLAAGLCRLGELAIHGLFTAEGAAAPEAGSGRYRAFVQRLLQAGGATLFSAYPVLARHAVELCDQWQEIVLELVTRLDADRAVIARVFGVSVNHVRDLQAGLSDRHAGGRQVMHLTFDSGLQLAYKPRDIGIEAAYNRWLTWLAEAGMPAAPPALRTVAGQGYGWVEWADAGAPTPGDVGRYFRQAGALVGMAYVLGGADLHSENLVASSRGPVLVDTEMLLQPSTRPGAPADGGDESEPAATADSCLLSGLVSAVVIDRNGVGFDVGGLRAAAARDLAVPARRWTGLGSDAIAFEPEFRVRPALRNDVVVDGIVQRPEDYASDICAGFAEACAFMYERRDELCAEDGPLAAFATCAVRVLFRPSDQYAAALYLTTAPRYQASGLARSLAFETLYRVFVSEVERPRIWPLVEDERAALEQRDIPRITLPAGATAPVSASGTAVEGYYTRSGLVAARDRLRSLTAGERRAQLELLRAALRRDDGPALPGARALDPRDRLVAAAERIGAAVLARADVGADGVRAWPSLGTREDLYGGSSGLGVFFAALAAMTGDVRWRAAAADVLTPCIARQTVPSPGTMRLGACTGLPSVAYALGLSGALLDDTGWRQAARDITCGIPEAAVAHDTVLDVEGGAAGLLLVLRAVHTWTPHDRLLVLARAAVSRLVAVQIGDGGSRGAWLAGDQPVARPGFAHGAAGIAAGLCRWADQGDTEPVLAAIKAAWAFEGRIAAANAGTYPTARSDGSRLVMAAWCHGAPGVGLGRLLAPPLLVDAELQQVAGQALHQTLTAPGGQLDHLCCGNLGRADVALTAGHVAGVQEWVDGGEALAQAVAARILGQGRLGMRGRGFQRGAASPGLFQGLAGIGYQLLRTAAPHRLPSLLAFDVPATGGSGGAIS